MTRLLEILISLAIVAVLFVLVGVLLPSSRTLVEQVETNRRQTIVFDTLNSFRRFTDWHPMQLRDPQARLNRTGADSGVGAILEFESSTRGVGKGQWEIVASEPRRSIEIAIEDESMGRNKRMRFDLRPTGRNNRNVEVTQTFNIDYGWNLIGRYAGLYVSRSVGDDMELGLRRLGTILASVPNVDYAVEGSKLANLEAQERPAENLLVVRAGAVERNTNVIKESMTSNLEWIERTLAANDLVAAGPMRIITTELGRETYNFDVAVPVRAASAADAASGNGEAGEDAAPAPVTVADEGELQDLELLGPVEYVRTEPGRVARADYQGFMAELENVRNALRAWALTQGYEVTGRAYETYNAGVEGSFSPEGEYEVVWPLRTRP